MTLIIEIGRKEASIRTGRLQDTHKDGTINCKSERLLAVNVAGYDVTVLAVLLIVVGYLTLAGMLHSNYPLFDSHCQDNWMNPCTAEEERATEIMVGYGLWLFLVPVLAVAPVVAVAAIVAAARLSKAILKALKPYPLNVRGYERRCEEQCRKKNRQ